MKKKNEAHGWASVSSSESSKWALIIHRELWFYWADRLEHEIDPWIGTLELVQKVANEPKDGIDSAREKVEIHLKKDNYNGKEIIIKNLAPVRLPTGY